MFLLATAVVVALGFSIYHYSKKYETPTTPLVPKTVKKAEEPVVKAEEPVKKTRKPRAKKITTKKKKDA